MTVQFVEGVAFEAIQLVLITSGPVLAVALVIGLAISILQATTQINEMTLAYIPKILAIYATLIFFAGFIIERLMAFTTGIFSDFTRFTQ